MASKPAVDGLERDLVQQASVLRINVRDDVGALLVRRFSAGITPTFIVLDGAGRETYRQSGGLPDIRRLRDEVALAAAPRRVPVRYSHRSRLGHPIRAMKNPFDHPPVPLHA